MAKSSISRRRYRRLPVEFPVRISTIDPEPDPNSGRPCFRASRDTCHNLSRGGLFVRTEDALTPGRRVLLEVELPGGGAFEAVGRVAWCRIAPGRLGKKDLGAGIEFLGGSLDQLLRLEEFLTAAPPRGS